MNHDDDLPELRDAASPRRNDAAFARAVAADVDARRTRKGAVSVLVPLLAPLGVGVGIFAFVAMHGPSRDLAVIVPTYLPDAAPDAAPDEPTEALVAEASPAAHEDVADDEEAVDDLDTGAVDVDDLDDDALVAFADPLPGARDHEPVFAFDGLDGSSDRELDDVEHALEAALAAKL
jgi:hypothetical protein